MSTTLRDRISQVRSELKLHSSDAPLSDRAIAAELKAVAIKYTVQRIGNRKLLNSSNIYTTIPCVKLEVVRLAECCEYAGDKKVSKSVHKLPKIVESSNYGLALQGVYSIDAVSRKFKEAQNIDKYINFLALGRESNDIFFWVMDSYLYVSDPNIETVRISAFFEEDVPQHFYSCDCAESCPENPLDQEFKCPAGLVEDVIRTVVGNLSNTYKRNVSDETPDGIEK